MKRNQNRADKKHHPSAAVSQAKKRPCRLESFIAKEYKVVALHERTVPIDLQLCDSPQGAADYWRSTVAKNPYLNSDCECLVILILDTRRRVKGHQLISIGTMDTLLVHAREVFRGAIVASAAAIILMHNHPSGDPSPSEADDRLTRELVRAGELLNIEVLDHVIMGQPTPGNVKGYMSFRALAWFELPPSRARRRLRNALPGGRVPAGDSRSQSES
jgi:DNA repair protein RadC